MWLGRYRREGIQMTPIRCLCLLLFGQLAVMRLVGVHEFGDSASGFRSLLFTFPMRDLFAWADGEWTGRSRLLVVQIDLYVRGINEVLRPA